ncbi:pyridoxine/pyridoxamine 5'-phosphate oxidase [Microbacterium excoecariae]|uniref:pyridoxine/pyridoxamine 5'-phosphate oxidase n=1 Tax=Microbacterium excoecariae TaxID=2715210 RepID=UPI001409B87F|nr:pyridoxamine 5'-phosphate oxidase family protein [Microbacterium excoecariae]NHI17901.1 pyridoxine 5'-phosphate oxidase [Microbacterium excoecariae]
MSAPRTPGAAGNVPPEGLDRPVQDGRVPADPADLLAAWLPGDDDPERPLCTLATVDEEGVPDARTVLVSGRREAGITFHTEGSSRKAQQLAAHPVAALVVRWPELARQVVLRGRVERTDPADEALAFARRSRYLQLLAGINTDALAAEDRATRERVYARIDAETPDPPQPDSWTGYALVPHEVTFWEGSDAAPSRRARYTRAGDGWSASFLAG